MYAGPIAQGISGIFGGIGAKKSAKRAASHQAKVGAALSKLHYSNQGDNNQVAQMRDRDFQNRMRDPADMARENSAFAQQQFRESLAIDPQKETQRNLAMGWEGVTASEDGRRRAVLSRILSPKAQMFSQNLANQMAAARQYQDQMVSQGYNQGLQQFKDVWMGGGPNAAPAPGGGFASPFIQPLLQGAAGAFGQAQAARNLQKSMAIERLAAEQYANARSGNTGLGSLKGDSFQLPGPRNPFLQG